MKIQNPQNLNYTSFNGLDARKLKGFVMNSNFAGIADDMKHIGELENFKIFLFDRNPLHHTNLYTDHFQTDQSHKGCWAQDFWGIVKNTLLFYEQSEKTDILQNTFKLIANPFQNKLKLENNIPKIQEYLDLLFNLPQVKKNGKDMIAIETPDGISFIDKKIYDAEFNINTQILKSLCNKTHVKGGNYFLTKNPDGTQELLIGQSELKKFSVKELQKMFLTDKIHIIPQADFHLDLFIRPLNNKKVLIADDEMMLDTLKTAFEKIQQAVIKAPYIQKALFQEPFIKTGSYMMGFKDVLKQNPYAALKDVEKSLIDAGYQPIKVPARLFDILEGESDLGKKYILRHYHNYINANVHINDKDELVYITNKSLLDQKCGLTGEIQEKTGFCFEKSFLDAIKPHVDKVYFVSGKNNVIPESLLPDFNGGIHCMCMEVPV